MDITSPQRDLGVSVSNETHFSPQRDKALECECHLQSKGGTRNRAICRYSFVRYERYSLTATISYGGELIRISPKDSKKLEYSKNNGLSWNARCGGSGNYGKFIDLMDNGKEILATTEKGLFYSTNKGLSWNVRKRG